VLYDFRVGESSTELCPDIGSSKRKWLVIIGRKHYFEAVKDYPVGSRRDLKRILKNEPWRYPFAGTLLLRLERLSPQSHRVTSWVVKQSVVDRLTPHPWFLVPESVCVGTPERGAAISLERLGSQLFVSRSPNGLVSIEGDEGLFRQYLSSNGLGKSVENVEIECLSQTVSLDKLIIGAAKAVRNAPLDFYTGPMIADLESVPVKRSFNLAAFALLIYLGLSTIYIVVSGVVVDRSIQAVEATAEDVMQIRETIVSNRRSLTALKEVVARSEPISVGWDLYLDLKAMGVSFTAIKTTSIDMEFFCYFHDATTVLRYLNDDPRVLEASFSSGVRQDRDMEVFSVRVKLAAPNGITSRIGKETTDLVKSVGDVDSVVESRAGGGES